LQQVGATTAIGNCYFKSINILSLDKPTAFMTKEDIFKIYVENIKEVLPHLQTHEFALTDSLKNLGANSIDRAEILMMTLESLDDFNAPLVEFAEAQTIGDLVNKLYAKV